MSFTLAIRNAPWGSTQWMAGYSQWMVYSGWLELNGTWHCPYGAYGATDLEILVYDNNLNLKHQKAGLGPIYDDKEYVYDCSTGVLSEVEAYEGTISRMELEYDGDRDSIPAYDIPQNDQGRVHIWGRNDMSTNQKMGIYWIVRDPDEIVVEEYLRWETFWTGPGNAQEFIGGHFPLDKVGTYGIQVGLLMNYDDPIYVDTYYGTLCTVEAAVPESEFRGFALSEYTKGG